jgi:isocitrate lyase
VRRINSALTRADQIQWSEGDGETEWFAPIVADAEAGFGGPLNAFELMKAMIEAGAAGVHFEDQLSSEKKCGHLGGKVLVPTSQFIRTLQAARLAADVCGVPTVLVARTDALSATLLTSDVDETDGPFLTGERTPEGFFRIEAGLEPVIVRSLAYAPYADLLWFETSTPDLGEAAEFAQAIHERFPGKPLAYNCSPSFNWRKHLDDEEIAGFQERLAELGYRFQFVTLAGFHALNQSMFELAHGYAAEGMTAYVRLRSANSSSKPTATRRPATSARSAQATSTRSSKRSARAPRSRSRVRPNKSSSPKGAPHEHDGRRSPPYQGHGRRVHLRALRGSGLPRRRGRPRGLRPFRLPRLRLWRLQPPRGRRRAALQLRPRLALGRLSLAQFPRGVAGGV